MDDRLRAYNKDLQELNERLKDPMYLMMKAYWSVYDEMIILYQKHFPGKTLDQATAEMETMLGISRQEWVDKKLNEFLAMSMAIKSGAKPH
jgi:hypothetical protein